MSSNQFKFKEEQSVAIGITRGRDMSTEMGGAKWHSTSPTAKGAAAAETTASTQAAKDAHGHDHS